MAKKEAGGKSASQNDFLEPLAPENVTATDVGTSRPYNDAAVTVTWEINELSPAADTYSVQVSGGSVLVNAAALPTPSSGTYTATVTGLNSDTSYTLEVFLTNSSGSSDATAASAVTTTSVPQTPSAPSVSSTVALTDDVSWTAPASGGSAITLYTWESNEDPIKTGTTTSTSVAVTNEANTTQKYRVKATNAN